MGESSTYWGFKGWEPVWLIALIPGGGIVRDRDESPLTLWFRPKAAPAR